MIEPEPPAGAGQHLFAAEANELRLWYSSKIVYNTVIKPLYFIGSKNGDIILSSPGSDSTNNYKGKIEEALDQSVIIANRKGVLQ